MQWVFMWGGSTDERDCSWTLRRGEAWSGISVSVSEMQPAAWDRQRLSARPADEPGVSAMLASQILIGDMIPCRLGPHPYLIRMGGTLRRDPSLPAGTAIGSPVKHVRHFANAFRRID